MIKPGPLWTPRTEKDLRAASNNGLLEETHYLDIKRELESGSESARKAANKKFAADIAAFSLDGGTIVIGVDEDTSPPSLHPVKLDGLAERVEQIAAYGVDEGVAISVDEIEAVGNSGYGYLIVHVPASPRAPHMANEKYYGRGDRTNRVLSAPEVRRLHEKQLELQRDVLIETWAVLNEIHGEVPGNPPSPMMILLAEPLGPYDSLLVPLADSVDWSSIVLEVVTAAVVPERQDFVPNLKTPSLCRRPGGVAATTGMSDGGRFPSPSRVRAAELVFHESGVLALASERPVDRRNFGPSVILETLVLGHTDLMMRVVSEVAARFGFAGSWRFGLIVTQLRGAVSCKLAEERLHHTGQGYMRDNYESSTTATLMELQKHPEQVVDRLVSSLLRSLGSHQMWPWLRSQT